MRTIIHIDLDAFFAAVEVLRNPKYRGKPLIVGGDPCRRRGVVATCSYEARDFGVRSAMPIQEARRRCPHGIFLRPDMATYMDYSRRFHQILYDFSPIVEPLSIDEAFVDMTGCEHFYPSPEAMGAAVKKRISRDLRLPASIGIAPNKFLAKLASESGKPDGCVVLRADEVQSFLNPLPVRHLWGVGPKTARKLHHAGIFYVRDLKKYTISDLTAHVGDTAAVRLHALARGIDRRPVEPPAAAKSFSRETTFEYDVMDEDTLRRTLARLVANVGPRLRSADRWANVVTIKVRFSDFTTITRQKALDAPVQNDDHLYHAALSLWISLKNKRPVRLIGVGAGDLTSVRQSSLFGDDDGPRAGDQISRTMDAVNAKLGADTLQRGRQWQPKHKG